MELAFEQIQCSCLQRAAHMALTQEQTQELIIPDSMPDAARSAEYEKFYALFQRLYPHMQEDFKFLSKL